MAKRNKYRRRRDNNRMGKICISFIVLLFIGVMSVQMVNLYEKDQEYIEREKSLEGQLAEETERQTRLSEYEAYTQTQQYIEDVAKSKLGLAYGNEIIFKEQD